MLYIKYVYKPSQSNFSPVDSGIPAVEFLPEPTLIKFEPDLYITEDTRMQYSTLPPVNPMVRNTQLKNDIPASPELFTGQTYDTNYSIFPSQTIQCV